MENWVLPRHFELGRISGKIGQSEIPRSARNDTLVRGLGWLRAEG